MKWSPPKPGKRAQANNRARAQIWGVVLRRDPAYKCEGCGMAEARLAELEGLLRIALDTRGDADVYRKWEGILEHRVKGATGCVYHALKRECRLCELLACAARIENGDEQE